MEADVVLLPGKKTKAILLFAFISFCGEIKAYTPRAKRNHYCCGIILRRIVERLISEAARGFGRVLRPLNDIANLLIRHDAIDPVRRENQEGIPSVFDLEKNKIIRDEMLVVGR